MSQIIILQILDARELREKLKETENSLSAKEIGLLLQLL